VCLIKFSVFSDSRLTYIPTRSDKIERARPNLGVLEEYKQREAEYLSRHDELEKATEERDDQKKNYEDLRKQRLDEFMAGFGAISSKLKEMYQVNCLAFFCKHR
jgi:structural maintenance of chromosome 4